MEFQERRTSVALHTSWRGRFTALVAPLVILTWGGYGFAVAGLQWFNGLLLLIGLALALVVMFDYPLWSTIGPEGVARRCVLRTERLDWSQVGAIARPGARQRFMGMGRGSGDEASKHSSGRAGLVAEVGRRPYLLVDRIESRVEHEAIRNGLKTWAPGLILRAGEPVDGTPPTWLYKRRKDDIEGMVDWR